MYECIYLKSLNIWITYCNFIFGLRKELEKAKTMKENLLKNEVESNKITNDQSNEVSVILNLNL